MDRPVMLVTGPVLDAPDVGELTRFYQRLLGWEVETFEQAPPGRPPGDGWSRLRPPDRSTKIEIQFEENYQPPLWPQRLGDQGMQMHLDIWVDDVARGVAWAKECGALEAPSQPTGRDPARLRVMLDPAGHPFCLWS
jgi:catechol 2,3-dioxygenase-like lactoylglutathione lyase family enzyme